MTKEVKEYILLAGYRRYNAVKKLGWKRVVAKVYGSDDIISVNLDEIDLGDNSRKDESSAALIELMDSIKQNGLIQPIVVARAIDLTEEDFIALNLTENLQRKDLSAFETSMKIKRLKELGLNLGEIAVRLGLPKSRIENLDRVTNTFTKEEMKKVSFIETKRKGSEGKISYTVAKNIANSRVNNAQKKELLAMTSKNELNVEKMDVVVKLVNAGMSTSKALKEAVKYDRIHPQILVKMKDMEKIKAETGYHSSAAVILGMLKGKIPLKPKMFYNSRDLKKIVE